MWPARRSQVLLAQLSFPGNAVSDRAYCEISSVSRSEKLGRGGTDRLAKPLIVIQRVQIPPDQSRAGRSVVSLAIHRVTGGCRSVDNKEVGREDSAPKSNLDARPTWLR